MNSITIGWKKSAFDKVEISPKKGHNQNRSNRKVISTKQQQASQNTEVQHARKVRFDKLYPESNAYASIPTLNLGPKLSDNSTNEIQMYNNNRLCSMRAAIATFIIVIILIAAAGASIGIVFAVINSQNSSGSGSNNQNSFSTISSGILTSSIAYGSQTGSPCSGYTQIDDPTRSINHTGWYSSCDTGSLFNTSNGGVWIRFVGTGGTTIPTSSPGMDHCGGFLAGWYNATLSTTPNVINNGTVCFETNVDQCGFATDISVVYCSGGFYVYFLPPVSACNARYCTV